MAAPVAVSNFVTNPVAFLQTILNHAPSLEALPHLSGDVASAMKENGDPTIALLYLQVAAKHLPLHTQVQPQNTSNSNNRAPLSAFPAGTGPQPFVLPSSAVSDSAGGHAQQAQNVNEISEALCYAARSCRPRSGIKESGILPVLEQLLPNNKTSNNSLIRPGPHLTPIQADLLHILLCAGEAKEAERIVMNEWPRPSRGLGVIVLMRYYYLRGLVHIECKNWEWAVRCFWTCLSIPADATSALVVAAWKKLVLVQALLQSDRLPADMNVLKTPKTTPVCVSRYINSAVSTATPERGAAKSPPAAGELEASVIAVGPEDISSPASSSTPLVHVHDLLLADSALSLGVANPQAIASSDSGVRAYSDLIRAFVKVNRENFVQVLQDNQTRFAMDGNTMLVKLVESELVKRQLYHWSRVVSEISLERLSELLSIPSVQIQSTIASMANKDQWGVEIKDQVAYFPKYISPVMSDSSADLERLTQMMQKLDVTLSTSSKFLSLVRREGANAPDLKGSGPRGVEDV